MDNLDISFDLLGLLDWALSDDLIGMVFRTVAPLAGLGLGFILLGRLIDFVADHLGELFPAKRR
jgi:hypothetical protein